MMAYSNTFKPKPKNSSEIPVQYLSVYPDNNHKSINNTNQPPKVPHPLLRRKKFIAKLSRNPTNQNPQTSISTAPKPSNPNQKAVRQL